MKNMKIVASLIVFGASGSSLSPSKHVSPDVVSRFCNARVQLEAFEVLVESDDRNKLERIRLQAQLFLDALTDDSKIAEGLEGICNRYQKLLNNIDQKLLKLPLSGIGPAFTPGLTGHQDQDSHFQRELDEQVMANAEACLNAFYDLMKHQLPSAGANSTDKDVRAKKLNIKNDIQQKYLLFAVYVQFFVNRCSNNWEDVRSRQFLVNFQAKLTSLQGWCQKRGVAVVFESELNGIRQRPPAYEPTAPGYEDKQKNNTGDGPPSSSSGDESDEKKKKKDGEENRQKLNGKGGGGNPNGKESNKPSDSSGSDSEEPEKKKNKKKKTDERRNSKDGDSDGSSSSSGGKSGDTITNNITHTTYNITDPTINMASGNSTGSGNTGVVAGLGVSSRGGSNGSVPTPAAKQASPTSYQTNTTNSSGGGTGQIRHEFVVIPGTTVVPGGQSGMQQLKPTLANNPPSAPAPVISNANSPVAVSTRADDQLKPVENDKTPIVGGKSDSSFAVQGNASGSIGSMNFGPVSIGSENQIGSENTGSITHSDSGAKNDVSGPSSATAPAKASLSAIGGGAKKKTDVENSSQGANVIASKAQESGSGKAGIGSGGHVDITLNSHATASGKTRAATMSGQITVPAKGVDCIPGSRAGAKETDDSHTLPVQVGDVSKNNSKTDAIHDGASSLVKSTKEVELGVSLSTPTEPPVVVTATGQTDNANLQPATDKLADTLLFASTQPAFKGEDVGIGNSGGDVSSVLILPSSSSTPAATVEDLNKQLNTLERNVQQGIDCSGQILNILKNVSDTGVRSKSIDLLAKLIEKNVVIDDISVITILEDNIQDADVHVRKSALALCSTLVKKGVKACYLFATKAAQQNVANDNQSVRIIALILFNLLVEKGITKSYAGAMKLVEGNPLVKN